MAGLTAANYSLNLNGNNNGKNKNGNNGSNASSLSSGNNGACPPALGANDPLPAGYVEFARAQVAARNEARRAAGLGVAGGGCGGRRHCICSGLGCDDLWAQWVAAGCPAASAGAAVAAGAHPEIIGNEDNFGLAGSIGNNNNNNDNNNNNMSMPSSIHSSNSENTQAYKMSKLIELENRFRRLAKNKRRNTRRRRVTHSRRNRRTRSRR